MRKHREICLSERSLVSRMCSRYVNPQSYRRPCLSGVRPDGYAKVYRRPCRLVLSKFQLDPHQPALFLFCGRRKDRIKGLLWDETGFLLLYKRLENGQYQWPDTPEDLLEISEQQLRWLTEGLSISQPKAVQKVSPAYSF